MPHFMILLILYINLLNLSWIKKCLFFEEYGAFKAPITTTAQHILNFFLFSEKIGLTFYVNHLLCKTLFPLKNKTKKKKKRFKMSSATVLLDTLTHLGLEIPKRVIGKQRRPRSDATKCGI